MNGLDANYFRKNLERIARDSESHTPHEMETALKRLAKVADSQKIIEPLNSGDLIAAMHRGGALLRRPACP